MSHTFWQAKRKYLTAFCYCYDLHACSIRRRTNIYELRETIKTSGVRIYVGMLLLICDMTHFCHSGENVSVSTILAMLRQRMFIAF